MKKFLIKVILFIAPVILLAVPLDYGLSYLLRQSDLYPGELEVWNDIYNSNANCDIAIYGSSRAWVQIDPKIIADTLGGSAYNFGVDGHNFRLEYLRHLELLKHNNKPKTIIFSVDIFTLQKRKDLYQFEQFLPFMLWNKNVQKYTSNYEGFTSTDYMLPLIRYAGKTSALNNCLKILIKGKPAHKYRDHGYRPENSKWNEDLAAAKKKQEHYIVKFDTATIHLFEQFIEECKSQNISLILVYAPEYIEGQKYIGNRKEVLDTFRNFSEKYHLPFFDYSNDSICFDKNLFYNSMHLNQTGAERFSSELAHDIKMNNNSSLSNLR